MPDVVSILVPVLFALDLVPIGILVAVQERVGRAVFEDCPYENDKPRHLQHRHGKHDKVAAKVHGGRDLPQSLIVSVGIDEVYGGKEDDARTEKGYNCEGGVDPVYKVVRVAVLRRKKNRVLHKD